MNRRNKQHHELRASLRFVNALIKEEAGQINPRAFSEIDVGKPRFEGGEYIIPMRVRAPAQCIDGERFEIEKESPAQKLPD